MVVGATVDSIDTFMKSLVVSRPCSLVAYDDGLKDGGNVIVGVVDIDVGTVVLLGNDGWEVGNFVVGPEVGCKLGEGVNIGEAEGRSSLCRLLRGHSGRSSLSCTSN